MAKAFDICIRGGGIVGRTLALLLAQAHLRVALVAHPPALVPDDAQPPGPRPDGAATDVRAFALNHKSRQLLQSLRCWPDLAHATPVLKMQVQGDDGGEVLFDAVDQGAPNGVDALAWIVDVPALLARLQEATKFAASIESVEQAVPATLTVVCEGRASSTRAEFGVDFDVASYAQSAIAARLSCGKPHGNIARQWFAQGEILGVLPLHGNSVAIVWSVDEARAQHLLHLPDAEFCEFLGQSSHGVYGEIGLARERMLWPLQQASASRWTGRNDMNEAGILASAIKASPGSAWVLAGDAAHTVHPLSGQGLNLGLADVAELASLIAKRDYWRSVADEKLLRQYERSRKTDAQALAWATDGLQQLFAKPGLPWQRLRNVGMSGFSQARGLKNWVARQAMGTSA